MLFQFWISECNNRGNKYGYTFTWKPRVIISPANTFFVFGRMESNLEGDNFCKKGITDCVGVLWFCYGSEAPPEMEKNMVFDGACISIMSLYLRKIYYPFVLIKIILISLPCQDCSSLKPFMLPYPTHAPRSQSILKSLKNVSLAVINLFRKNNKQKCFPDEKLVPLWLRKVHPWVP